MKKLAFALLIVLVFGAEKTQAVLIQGTVTGSVESVAAGSRWRVGDLVTGFYQFDSDKLTVAGAASVPPAILDLSVGPSLFSFGAANSRLSRIFVDVPDLSSVLGATGADLNSFQAAGSQWGERATLSTAGLNLIAQPRILSVPDDSSSAFARIVFGPGLILSTPEGGLTLGLLATSLTGLLSMRRSRWCQR